MASAALNAYRLKTNLLTHLTQTSVKQLTATMLSFTSSFASSFTSRLHPARYASQPPGPSRPRSAPFFPALSPRLRRVRPAAVRVLRAQEAGRMGAARRLYHAFIGRARYFDTARST